MNEKKKIVEILKNYGIHIDVEDLKYLGNDIDNRIYQYEKGKFWIRIKAVDVNGETYFYFQFPKMLMLFEEDKLK